MTVKVRKRKPDSKLRHIPATVSNAIWVKKSDLSPLDLEQVLKASHIYGEEKYDGSGAHELMAYIDRGRYLGLPRGFFQDFFNQTIDVTDQQINWPKWQFPDGLSWRAGQEESVKALLAYLKPKDYGQCRLEAGCGTGKTCMSLYVASQLKMRTLILVHKEELALAFYKEARRFLPGIKFGHCQQDSWVYKNCHIVSATFQTLFSRDSKLPKNFLSRFGLVVVDEGQRSPAQTFEGVLRKFTAKYRLGVSATWRRRDGLDKVFDAHLGPIVHRATSASLNAQYICPRLLFRPHIINPRHWAYVVNGIASNTEYRNWLAKEAVKCVLKGERTPLMLADRIEMLKDLRERINELFRAEGYPNKKAMLFIGETNNADKRKAMKNAAVMLGSWGKWNEGNNLPRLDTLFIVTPRSDIEQAAGRIRRVVDGKKMPLIVDPFFTSCANPMLRGSAYARIRQYKALGFQEAKK